MAERKDAGHEQDLCFWEDQGERFEVGIVGGGGGFGSLLHIITDEGFSQYLPEMRLAAVAELDRFPAAERRARELGVPAYPDFRDMLNAHPEINLIVELTRSNARLEDIRSAVGPQISLLDHREAVFMCGLHDMAMVKSRFRNSLERQRLLLHSIIDEVREDILLLDLQGRIVDLNRNVWTRAGKKREELVGLPCWQAVVIDDSVMFCPGEEKECPFYGTLHARVKGEAMFTRLDEQGRLRYFRVYSYPIFGAGGEMTHVMMMHRDITERTSREKQEQHRDRLAAIGELSTYLAHEIRNPLCAIGGYASSLLRSGNLQDTERSKVQIMYEETSRLERILSSILSFAKPRGTPTEAVDLGRVVQDTVELMRVGYRKSGCVFHIRMPESLPRVEGNEDVLKQCLVNLLKNAVEAMPNGGDISVVLDREGQMVRLRVKDTGVGMDRKELDRIFNPFYTTKPEGSGLGLAMIKKTVDELDGSISMNSRPGEGTIVTLLLQPALSVGAEDQDECGESSSADTREPDAAETTWN